MSIPLGISTVQATEVTADWQTWAAKYGRYPDVAMYFQSMQTEPLMYSAAITDCVNLGMTPNVAWSTGAGFDLSTVTTGALDSQFSAAVSAIESSALTEVQARIWHEFNAPVNPYGPLVNSNGNPSDATFIAAFQYAVNKLRTGTNKIKIVWCADFWTAAGAAGGHNQVPSSRWPGAAYVDIIGWDGYSTTGYTVSFDNALGGSENNYGTLMGQPGASGIPFQVSESGTGVESQKETWYQSAIYGGGGLQAKYPALVQFNVFDRVTDGEYTIDGTGTGGTPDPVAAAVFRSSVNRAPFIDTTPARRSAGA